MFARGMTTRSRLTLLSAICLACLRAGAADAASFAEVYGLVRSNLTRIDDKALDQMAVEGFLQKLGGLAQIGDTKSDLPTTGGPGPVARVHDGHYGYVRLVGIGADAASGLAAALAGLAATNDLKGVVLDLRFAGGRDFAAAARIADLFLPGGRPVLDWGEGPFISTAKTHTSTNALAVLVNRQTRGAAEAAAAALRQTGTALVLGATTAGEASLYRDFPLSSGLKLSLAVIAVKTGDGEPVPATGVIPDIVVNVRPEVERGYLADPFGVVRPASAATSQTNQIVSSVRVRKRLTEADLVKAKQSGRPLESASEATNPTATPTEPQKIVRDPVLARALDLLKGLDVMRSR